MAMTVTELINVLLTVPGDARVVVLTDMGHYESDVVAARRVVNASTGDVEIELEVP